MMELPDPDELDRRIAHALDWSEIFELQERISRQIAEIQELLVGLETGKLHPSETE